MNNNEKQLEQTNEFVRLILKHKDQIHAYILSMIPNWNEAEDLLQDAIFVMLKNFDKFEPGTSFTAWGKTIARFEVLNYLKRTDRKRFIFSDETIQAISQHIEPKNDDADKRLEALENCLKKLPMRDHQLIVMRYESGATTKSVAGRLEVSLQSVYRSVHRIHAILLRCINRSITTNTRGQM